MGVLELLMATVILENSREVFVERRPVDLAHWSPVVTEGAAIGGMFLAYESNRRRQLGHYMHP